MRVEERLARRGGLVECLRPLSTIYGAVVGLHGRLHDRRWLPSEKLDVPVLSVGNLTVGGTGKTPMVIWLARELERRGFRPGILARGYSRASGSDPGLNDEGRMIERATGGIPQVQRPDRVVGGHELISQGCDVIVLDDGFQHRRLRRDVDLVLVDATRPWGLEACGEAPPVKSILPRGLLREPPRALARAQALVLTRTDQVSASELERLEDELERDALGVPRIFSIHKPKRLVELQSGAESPLSSLAGTEVELLSGIGNPEGFERSLETLGARVKKHHKRPDHHEWSAEDLADVGAGDVRVITTAKDGVKLEKLGEPAGSIQVLEIELEITRGDSVLSALLDGLSAGRAARERAALHEGLHG